MKRPSKKELEANALRQIDTLSRWHIQDMRTVHQFTAAGVPCDWWCGRLTGYELSIAILATDLGIASFIDARPNTSAFSLQPSALLGRAA